MAAQPDVQPFGPFISMPIEIQHIIADLLVLNNDTHSLNAWSATSKEFRKLLAPRIFDFIDIPNGSDCSHALAISQCQHAGLVQELSFEDSAADVNVSGEPAPSILKPAVRELFTNLKRFSNLKTLVLEVGVLHYVDVAQCEPDPDPWKGIHNSIYAQIISLIIANPPRTLEALQLHSIEPFSIQEYTDPRFHILLNSLESFTMQIDDYDNPTQNPWLNQNLPYRSFAQQLDIWFFNHLSNAKQLCLVAPYMTLIGNAVSPNVTRLAFGARQMPALHELDLFGFFICPELLEFLTAKASMLTKLSMRKCHASPEGVSWEIFFRAILEAQPTRLRHFRVWPLNALTLNDGMQVFGTSDISDERRLEKAERSTCSEDDRKLLFSYQWIDSSGSNADDRSHMIHRAQSGEDEEPFWRLMKLAEGKSMALS